MDSFLVNDSDDEYSCIYELFFVSSTPLLNYTSIPLLNILLGENYY